MGIIGLRGDNGRIGEPKRRFGGGAADAPLFCCSVARKRPVAFVFANSVLFAKRRCDDRKKVIIAVAASDFCILHFVVKNVELTKLNYINNVLINPIIKYNYCPVCRTKYYNLVICFPKQFANFTFFGAPFTYLKKWNMR